MAQSTFSEVFDKKLEVMERELAYVVCLEMLQQEKSAANQYFNEKLPNVSGVVMVIDLIDCLNHNFILPH